MSDAWLTLHDMVRGLERFGDRYQAIDVFADNVKELHTGETVEGLSKLDEIGRQYSLSMKDKLYRLELFPDAGIVRLVRTRQTPRAQTVIAGALIGGLAGATMGAATEIKEGMGAGLVLGLLAGAVLGGVLDSSSSVPHPRRVFTLRFDQDSREWRAYDGGLVRWMKKQAPQLNPAQDLEDVDPVPA